MKATSKLPETDGLAQLAQDRRRQGWALIVTGASTMLAGLVIGYAFDGYPILVPLSCDDASCTSTHELSSSWRLTLAEYTTATRGPAWDIHEFVDGLGDLDECNGMAITSAGSPYDYAYFATDTFPYFLGCYRGTPEIPRL